jgi:hypothetical protein
VARRATRGNAVTVAYMSPEQVRGKRPQSVRPSFTGVRSSCYFWERGVQQSALKLQDLAQLCALGPQLSNITVGCSPHSWHQNCRITYRV